MRKFRHIIVPVLMAVLFGVTACNRDGFSKADFEITDVCLRVKGVNVFLYEPYSSQIALNKGRKEFRAGSDTMSD